MLFYRGKIEADIERTSRGELLVPYRKTTKNETARAAGQETAQTAEQEIARAAGQEVTRAAGRETMRATGQEVARAARQEITRATGQEVARAARQEITRAAGHMPVGGRARSLAYVPVRDDTQCDERAYGRKDIVAMVIAVFSLLWPWCAAFVGIMGLIVFCLSRAG